MGKNGRTLLENAYSRTLCIEKHEQMYLQAQFSRQDGPKQSQAKSGKQSTKIKVQPHH
jgi:hypothetical protein